MRAPLRVALLAVAACPAAGLAQGTSARNQLGLDFNDDAVRAVYAHQLGGGPLRLDGGWLHHQDKGDVIHAGLQVVGQASSAPGAMGGLGLRGLFLDGESSDGEGYGVAVGGSLQYVLPRYNRFFLGLDAWLAPDVLAGGDVEDYRDLTVRAGYSVTRQAGVYLGARYVRAELDDRPDEYLDTGIHVGIDLRF